MRTGDAGERDREKKSERERGREKGEKEAVARFRAAFSEATRGESVESVNDLAAELQVCSSVIAREIHGVANERADEHDVRLLLINSVMKTCILDA